MRIEDGVNLTSAPRTSSPELPRSWRLWRREGRLIRTSELVSVAALVFQLLLGAAAFAVCLGYAFAGNSTSVLVMFICSGVALAFVSVAVGVALLKMRIRGLAIAYAFTFMWAGVLLGRGDDLWCNVGLLSLAIVVLLSGLLGGWVSRRVMAKRGERRVRKV